ncbi:MAG: hypothetical protein ABEK03_09630 [Candidatus Bipolaricaulia bacterium]
MMRAAINGLRRIGRAALKIILDTPENEWGYANQLIREALEMIQTPQET